MKLSLQRISNIRSAELDRRLPAMLLGFSCIILASSLACAQPNPATQATSLLSSFDDRVENLRAELIDVRRDIHRYPEVSGHEERTAGIVADRLRAAGFEVRTEVGGHGVVGLLRGSTDGPLLAFRADMDAVPSSAPDRAEFKSEIDGVRHICGHDIHTTIGLALAEGFASVQDKLTGSVMLIFQPAEENATGAEAMLADGVFADLLPDALFAYHTAPFEVGQIATAIRTLMPGRDAVRIEISGEGDLNTAAQAVRAIIENAGTLSPEEANRSVRGEFVSVGGIRSERNRTGDGLTLRTILTTSSLAASSGAQGAIEQGLSELELADITVDLEYRERFIAGVTNSPSLVEAANASARNVLGSESVISIESMIPTFSEDFGSFQKEVPGVMYFLGVSNAEEGWVGMPHSPDYMADEEAIFVGAQTMAAVFFDLFVNGVPEDED